MPKKYIFSLLRDCSTDDVGKVKDEIEHRHNDENFPGFEAVVLSVLKNVKMLTIGDPSDEALQWLREHPYCKVLEEDQEVQAL